MQKAPPYFRSFAAEVGAEQNYKILPILSPFAPSSENCTSFVVTMSQQFITSSIDNLYN